MSKLAKSTMKKTPFDQSSFGMGFVQGSGIHARRIGELALEILIEALQRVEQLPGVVLEHVQPGATLAEGRHPDVPPAVVHPHVVAADVSAGGRVVDEEL